MADDACGCVLASVPGQARLAAAFNMKKTLRGMIVSYNVSLLATARHKPGSTPDLP
jgi:hypothetical protein